LIFHEINDTSNFNVFKNSFWLLLPHRQFLGWSMVFVFDKILPFNKYPFTPCPGKPNFRTDQSRGDAAYPAGQAACPISVYSSVRSLRLRLLM
jgi:hypothetical protein